MARTDPRIDAYIAKSAEFARPILRHLRAIVHAGCPEVEETMKWNFPHFVHHGVLCGMAAFKAHCAFGFWRGDLVVPSARSREQSGMGQFGRITSLDDLPPARQLKSLVARAARLNASGALPPRQPRQPERTPRRVPPDLAAALRENATARRNFEAFPPSHRREYIEWITEAKRDETRQRRLATTLEWLTAGKSRNWKYERR